MGDAVVVDDERHHTRLAVARGPGDERGGDLPRVWHDAGLTEVVQDMLTIRMDFACFADFWAPIEGKEGPVAAYVGALGDEDKIRLQAAVRLAYLDGEADGARSYAATARVVRGTVP